MYFEYHRGVMTTQANHKRNMRDSEEQTLNAEKYASLAWLSGKAYPGAELTEAWKKITFNDFHDLAAGSGIGVIYKEAQKDFDQVRWRRTRSRGRAEGDCGAGRYARGSGVPVLVFNPSGLERGAACYGVGANAVGGRAALRCSMRKQVVPSQVLSSDAKTNTYHAADRGQRCSFDGIRGAACAAAAAVAKAPI